MLGQADEVWHCAWSCLPFAAEKKPSSCWENDIPLLFKFLEHLRDLGPRAPHFVFFSSGSVYGDCSGMKPSEERDKLPPLSWYAKGKLAAEEIIQTYGERYGIGATIFRISNLYGFPSQLGRLQGLVSVLLEAAKNKTAFRLWGSGKQKKDYLYIGDLAEALRLAPKDSMGVSCYNLSTGIGHDIFAIHALVEKIAGTEIPLLREEALDVTWDPKENVLSSARIESDCNWIAKTSLEEGISQCWERLQKQR